MDSSLKIGAVSGLIAGLVAGILMILVANIAFNIGINYWDLDPTPITPLTSIAMIEIVNNILWGILLGIIFSRIYDLIPGRAVSKGLLFGLVYYAIFSIRHTTFMTAYGNFPIAIGALLHIHPIVFGLVFVLLYKAPLEKLKIEKYDIKSGIYAGVITGILFTPSIIISYFISAYFGTVLRFMETIPDYLTDVGLIINQFGSHAVINMLWFGIYGAFYAMFYDRIPGKHLVKASIFGVIIMLITSFRICIYWLQYGSIAWANSWGWWDGAFDLGFWAYIYAGLLLEGFYKRRPRAFLVAGVIFVFMIVRGLSLAL